MTTTSLTCWDLASDLDGCTTLEEVATHLADLAEYFRELAEVGGRLESPVLSGRIPVVFD